MYLGFFPTSYEEQKVGNWGGSSGLQLSADNQDKPTPPTLPKIWGCKQLPADWWGRQKWFTMILESS